MSEQARKPWTLRELWGKPLWDWLDLLIVPVALLVIGGAFTAVQNYQQQGVEDARAKQAQDIENQRAKAERELGEQRAQDEALQTYLGQMGDLILEQDLRNSKDSEVRMLARARTLTVLDRLDPDRKVDVMRFLTEACLVTDRNARPVISLNSADLNKTKLRWFDLRGVDLTQADLSGADLQHAYLDSASMGEAVLSRADLREANMHNANLVGTNLSGADLSGADLSGAFAFQKDQREQVESLKGATMPNDSRGDVFIPETNCP